MHIIYLDQLPSDIIHTVHNQLDFSSQSHLRLTSINFTKYPITNLLDNVPNKNNLTDNILKSYPYIIKLSAHNNEKYLLLII